MIIKIYNAEDLPEMDVIVDESSEYETAIDAFALLDPADSEDSSSEELDELTESASYDELSYVPYQEPISYLWLISVLVFSGIVLTMIHQAFRRLKDI